VADVLFRSLGLSGPHSRHEWLGSSGGGQLGIFVLLWLGLSVGAAVIAGNKGRSAIGFFLLALLLSPLVGFLAAVLAREDRDRIERRRFAKSGGAKKCLFCATWISWQASVCPHCGRDQFAPRVPQVVSAPDNLCFCSRCGRPAAVGDRFCGSCGQSLDSVRVRPEAR
jgi:hypothetical protein